MRSRRRPSESEVVARADRRAVVVLTDGIDNSSRMSPSEVSGIASEIDVPVYLFGIVPAIDNPSAETASQRRSSRWSARCRSRRVDRRSRVRGEHAGASAAAARQIIDELRHQYLIAFESSGNPGWHPLVVRARRKDLTVRARSGTIAGQSRPVSH